MIGKTKRPKYARTLVSQLISHIPLSLISSVSRFSISGSVVCSIYGCLLTYSCCCRLE